MSRPAGPLPTQLPAAFTVTGALAAGSTRRRLRARDLEAPFRGVRRRRAPEVAAEEGDHDTSASAFEARRLRRDIAQRVRDYALILPDGALFSHATAAVIWGLPLPLRALRSVAREIDVAVLGARRGSKARGVSGHQLRPEMTVATMRGGLAVTSPETTWALLAPVLSSDELVEVADAVVYIPRRRGMLRGDPDDALGTIEGLERAMASGRRVGAPKLRRALADVRVGAASPSETRLRLACVRGGLPEPELDVDVFAANGVAIGFTELAYPKYRVLVEYEGDHHRTDRRQWNRDIEKHAACVDAGWDPVRITARSITRGGADAVARVRAALVRGGWRPGAS